MGLTKDQWRERYFDGYEMRSGGAARTLVKHSVLSGITNTLKISRDKVPDELLATQIEHRRIVSLIRDLKRLEKKYD